MIHFLSQISAPIIVYFNSIASHSGYTILFIASLLEGLPILGQFIPGHTIVIFSGFLAKIGVLNIYFVITSVILGATIGDIIGFIIGRKFGFAFLSKFAKYLFITESHIEKAKKLINEHAGKTIILGRFSPITRQLTPFIVGASGIHIKKFWLYDIFGVILWTIASVLLGYVFGASYHMIASVFGKFIIIAIIISIMLIWGYRFINREFHLFAKYELITLIASISGLYIFFKTLQDAISINSFMSELDIWVNLFISERINQTGVFFMNIISNVFSVKVLAIISFVFIIYFIYKKQWRYSIITFLSVGLGLFLNALMKELIMRIRPISSAIIESGYSFPSGHATIVTIFFTLVIYFSLGSVKKLFYRELIILSSVIVILLVSFSRLYLGVHWLSDVIAGISFGLFWTTFIILLVKYLGMLSARFINYGK